MHREVAPEMLELAHKVGQSTQSLSDDDAPGFRSLICEQATRPHKNNNKDARNELVART
jgi:hypothetical protein